MKKALVTGATGFIGSHLVKQLLRENFSVAIFVRERSDLRRLREIIHRLKQYRVDLGDRKRLQAAVKKINPDYVFHLAAAGLRAGVSSAGDDLIKTNFAGTVNLIDACQEIDYKCFVNTGSSSEYGPQNKAMKETDFCQPDTFYGVTKLGGTLYGQLAARLTKKPIVSLRVFSPFGPADDDRRLIAAVVRKALLNEPLALSRPEIARDYIYIEDLIDLYLAVIKKPRLGCGQIFNAGTGRQRTVAEAVSFILKETKSQSKPLWNAFPLASYDSCCWRADMKKTNKTFAWRPKVSFEDGLRKTIAWWQTSLSR